MRMSVAATGAIRSRHSYSWLALALLAVLAISLGCRRLFYPYFVDEFWVVRGVGGGARDITPALL